MIRFSLLIILLISQLVFFSALAVEDTAKRVIASHTRDDIVVLPSVEQLDQLSDTDLQRLITALGGAEAAAKFTFSEGDSEVDRNRQRDQKREFIRAQLIRVEARGLNNPFNTNDPLNNSFVNGQVVPIAPDDLNNLANNQGDDQGGGNQNNGDQGGGNQNGGNQNGGNQGGGNQNDGNQGGGNIPVAPPLAMGQIFQINIGAGNGLKLDIIGGQLLDIGGLAASATISITRNGSVFEGTVNKGGLLPAGGATQFFAPVFNLSQTGQPSNTQVSTLDGKFFSLGSTQAVFAFRRNAQNFIITTRQAFAFNRLANGGFTQPGNSTNSVHIEIRPGDNGVIAPISNCPVQTLAVVPTGFLFEANVAFDLANSRCRYNVSDRTEFFEFNQNVNFTTGNCGEMKLRRRNGVQLLLNGAPFQNPAILALGSSHTLRFTDTSSIDSARESGRVIEFDFTVENTLAACIAAGGQNGNSVQAELTGRITINAVRELP